jgi:hypothetical protein
LIILCLFIFSSFAIDSNSEEFMTVQLATS